MSEIQITSPKTNSFIKKSDNVTLVTEVPTSTMDDLVEINLILQDLETRKMTVLSTFTSFTSDWNGKIITTWVPAKSGIYEFFVRTKDTSEKLTLSDRVKVTVQGD